MHNAESNLDLLVRERKTALDPENRQPRRKGPHVERFLAGTAEISTPRLRVSTSRNKDSNDSNRAKQSDQTSMNLGTILYCESCRNAKSFSSRIVKGERMD